MPKPKIRPLWTGMWLCHFNESIGYGRSPGEAYWFCQELWASAGRIWPNDFLAANPLTPANNALAVAKGLKPQ